MKPTTKNGRKKLAPETARLIRRSHGFRAAIARAGRFHRSYVTRVLTGTRPPSPRFLEALAEALYRLARQADLETFLSQYPRTFARAERRSS